MISNKMLLNMPEVTSSYEEVTRLKDIPVSIKEIDESVVQYDMGRPCSDPCPECSGSMQVGDYVCWGFCYKCYQEVSDGNNL